MSVLYWQLSFFLFFENMINTLKKTNEILKKYNITANKRYGQNFLIYDNVLESIVEKANINENDLVIEIGPGLGNLTEYILDRAKFTILIEIDNNMINILNDRFSRKNNYMLLNEDVMKITEECLSNTDNIEIDAKEEAEENRFFNWKTLVSFGSLALAGIGVYIFSKGNGNDVTGVAKKLISKK